MVVLLFFPGRPKCALLDYYFWDYHFALMAVHALFYELDLHDELHDPVSFSMLSILLQPLLPPPFCWAAGILTQWMSQSIDRVGLCVDHQLVHPVPVHEHVQSSTPRAPAQRTPARSVPGCS